MEIITAKMRGTLVEEKSWSLESESDSETLGISTLIESAGELDRALWHN